MKIAGQRWRKIQEQSFYRATARERAAGLADDGTFRELLGPLDKICSPHLPLLGEVAQFDDGMVTGIGLLGTRPVFIISMEGTFLGGGIGEVNGAKMTAAIRLACYACDAIREKYDGQVPEGKRPVLVISFDTGGVRLHEANAGLLAHADIIDAIQDARGKVPMLSLCGSRLGAFGGMGFVIMATDVVIMNEQGRIGLTGPEVIEEEVGRDEFDASDRALVWRTTGAKHRYIMGDCDYLVADRMSAFRKKVLAVAAFPLARILRMRKTGSFQLVKREQELVALGVKEKIKDSTDFWRYFGNDHAENIPEMELGHFLQTVKRRQEAE